MEHDNEASRSTYLNALFETIAFFFHKRIINRLENKLVDRVVSKEKVQNQYIALDSVIIVFIEVKHQVDGGKGGLDQLAQVMTEGDGGYFKADNSRFKLIYILTYYVFNCSYDMWVPMRGILTDAEKFVFVEHQSDTRTWFKSDLIQGIDLMSYNDREFAISVKKSILVPSLAFKR